MKKLLFITASIMAIILVFVVVHFSSFWPDSNKGTTATNGPVKTSIKTPVKTPTKTPSTESGDVTESESSNPYLFFRPNDGEGGCTLYIGEESQHSYKIPKSIVHREGYTFKHWNTEPDGTGKILRPDDVIPSLSEVGASTLYAIWEKDTQINETNAQVQRLVYTSNFLGEGGCMQYFSNQEQFPYTILEPMVVDSQSKYTFLYWNTKEDGSGKTFYPGDVIARFSEVSDNSNNIILYAIWDDTTTPVVEPDDTVERINWDFWLEYSDSFTGYYYTEHIYGGGFAYYTIKAAPESEKNFLCWNTAPDGSGRTFSPGDVVFSLSEINSTKLYAIWEE